MEQYENVLGCGYSNKDDILYPIYFFSTRTCHASDVWFDYTPSCIFFSTLLKMDYTTCLLQQPKDNKCRSTCKDWIYKISYIPDKYIKINNAFKIHPNNFIIRWQIGNKIYSWTQYKKVCKAMNSSQHCNIYILLSLKVLYDLPEVIDISVEDFTKTWPKHQWLYREHTISHGIKWYVYEKLLKGI